MNRIHNITAEPGLEGYQLCNNGVVCGARLNKGGTFPLKTFQYDTEAEAKTAAVKLQKYLDEREVKLKKK